jgi:hypothetical protein
MNNWNNLKPESKLWIYGANRPFEPNDAKQIEQILDQFCETWAAHGTKLNCGFNLLYNRFILIAVDEESAAASGCSIDKAVEIVRQIDERFSLDLFNRLRSFEVDQVKNTVSALTIEEVQEGLATGEIDEDTRIVNMQALQLGHLIPNFTLPLSHTWLRKYLRTEPGSSGV